MKFTFATSSRSAARRPAQHSPQPLPADLLPGVDNAQGAADDKSNTTQSRGDLRVSIYAIYQQKKNVALIGRAGVDEADFSSNANANGAAA